MRALFICGDTDLYCRKFAALARKYALSHDRMDSPQAARAADFKRINDTEQRRSFCVAVNLSPRQFRDPQLVEIVRQAVEAAAVDPRLIKLEITEGARAASQLRKDRSWRTSRPLKRAAGQSS